MARLLSLPEPPTAVFAYSDELAFAAIAHARGPGRRAPGRVAAKLAVRLVAGEDGVSDVRVPTRLVDRGSTSVR